MALAVSEGVRTVVGNHTYIVGDQIYLQSTGSPIGLDISSLVWVQENREEERKEKEKARLGR